MTTLHQAASYASMAMNPPTKPVKKTQGLSALLKEIKQIPAWSKEWLASKTFILMDLPLGKAANPIRPDHNKMLRSLASSADSVKPIVVDVNKKQIGATHGFYPKVIVVHGSEIYSAAETQGRNTIRAWVGEQAAKAMNLLINADHDIGVEELRQKLMEKLSGKYKPINNGTGSSAWITDIFPFENYFIYKYQGKDFKQVYSIDGSRNIAFVSSPVEVRETYVEAARVRAGTNAIIRMKRPAPAGIPDNKMEAKKKKKKVSAEEDEAPGATMATAGVRQPLRAAAAMHERVQGR